MKIIKIVMPILILSCIGMGLEAKSKQKKQESPSAPLLEGPSGQTKSICPPCVSLTCPIPSPTGATACTGPECFCTPETIATFCCLNVNNVATSFGNLAVGNEVITGDVLVGLNAHFRDGLIVEEDANFSNNVCIGSDKHVEGNADIDGFVVILGDLLVEAGGLSVSGPTIINGNDFINGSLSITGNQNVTGTITVGSTAQFNGPLIVTGVSGPSGTTGASGTGQVIVTNGSTISGGLIIVNPSGCTGCTGAFINGNVCVVGNTVANNVDVEGTLTVDELATLNNVFVATGSTLITNGPVIMNDGLTITGDEIMQSGSKFVGGNLSVNGSSNFESPVFINEGATIANGLTVHDGSTVDSLAIPNGSLFVSGTLDVNGSITSNTGLSTLSSLTLTDTTNSLCPSGPEGALIVLGGAGIGASGRIGRDLWLGGSEYFALTEAEGGIPTSFDYYEESCFSTAFTWAGLTVTPPASVMVKAIRVGNIVNLKIPSVIINNPGAHIDVITSTTPIPDRFRPFTTVRGAASTIVSNARLGTGPTGVTGSLGEYNVSPAGVITFGYPASQSGPLGLLSNALGPQRIVSSDFVQKDIDTITYNINSCERRCKLPCA